MAPRDCPANRWRQRQSHAIRGAVSGSMYKPVRLITAQRTDGLENLNPDTLPFQVTLVQQAVRACRRFEVGCVAKPFDQFVGASPNVDVRDHVPCPLGQIVEGGLSAVNRQFAIHSEHDGEAPVPSMCPLRTFCGSHQAELIGFIDFLVKNHPNHRPPTPLPLDTRLAGERDTKSAKLFLWVPDSTLENAV